MAETFISEIENGRRFSVRGEKDKGDNIALELANL
jgi:hypothetical protein